MHRPVDLVLSRLDLVKPNGERSYVAACPSHQDRSPSLSVSEGDDGRVLMNCHAGCSIHDITAAIGLKLKDLFPASNMTRHERQEYCKQKDVAEFEKAMLHELHILVQVVGNRVSSRKIKNDKNFRKQRPEWSQYPDEHWGRELLAVERLKRALEKIYEY